jgi:hypothetical protein
LKPTCSSQRRNSCLTLAQIANIFGLKRRSIIRWARVGTIPPELVTRDADGKLRVSAVGFDRLVKRGALQKRSYAARRILNPQQPELRALLDITRAALAAQRKSKGEI